MPSIEWIAIQDPLDSTKDIGAVGFVGNDVVTIVSFYEGADADRSGDVSMGEWLVSKLSPLSVDGMAITQVCMAAKYDDRIFMRDMSIIEMANKQFAQFATSLVMDGIYAVYFSRGVKMGGSAIAKSITQSMVKQMIIRKGFEKVAKEAYKSTY
ncbi:hypothetical protein [Vannielia sp.]|uniref:hypothetical protein n=1 Tax=Vannielia sp. TaxID=2813045 RepID=UPI002605782F|nr:hypothetical protein [Vannielia sp.]MDF1872433.1 hypothetical protein [Vannielia sp.]